MGVVMNFMSTIHVGPSACRLTGGIEKGIDDRTADAGNLAADPSL
jgi:hypothetical protein